MLAIDGVSDVDDAKIWLCDSVSVRSEVKWDEILIGFNENEFLLLFLIMRTVPIKPKRIRSERAIGMMIL